MSWLALQPYSPKWRVFKSVRGDWAVYPPGDESMADLDRYFETHAEAVAYADEQIAKEAEAERLHVQSELYTEAEVKSGLDRLFAETDDETIKRLSELFNQPPGKLIR